MILRIRFVPEVRGVLGEPVPLSAGLLPGAAGLPKRQIPQRSERPVGLAARRDLRSPVDLLLHATLLRAGRAAPAHNGERGEEKPNLLTVRVPLPLKFTFSFQLLQAFYRQQGEIRDLREELNQKEVRTQAGQPTGPRPSQGRVLRLLRGHVLKQ